MADFTEFYRGYAVHIQVCPAEDGRVDVWCQIVDPNVARITPVTASVDKVPGGPFSAHIGRDIGVAYGAGVIDAYLRGDVD